jgi:hypothetical protein
VAAREINVMPAIAPSPRESVFQPAGIPRSLPPSRSPPWAAKAPLEGESGISALHASIESDRAEDLPVPCRGPRRRPIHHPFRVMVRAGGPSTVFQCRSRHTEWMASRSLSSGRPTARPVRPPRHHGHKPAPLEQLFPNGPKLRIPRRMTAERFLNFPVKAAGTSAGAIASSPTLPWIRQQSPVQRAAPRHDEPSPSLR